MKNHFISYPKSGRSWVRYALNLLDVAEDIQFHHDGFEFNDGSKPEHNFALEERRLRYANDCKVIYLSRHPFDVLVSLYHQVTGRFDDFFHYTGTVSDFIRDDYFGAVPLKRFRDQWNELSKEEHVLQIRYEQCHEDMESVLRSIVAHLEIDPERYAKANFTEIVDKAAFDNMRKVEESREFEQPWLRPRMNAYKVRRGKVGGYADELPDDDVIYLNSIFGDAL